MTKHHPRQHNDGKPNDQAPLGNTTTATTAIAKSKAASPPKQTNNSDTSTTTTTTTTTIWWRRALQAALKGGASGSIAMVLQVILLMWLRTTVNYQYKHGVDAKTAFLKLYQEGGILRFYRGVTLALLTGPISRFGDTASNEGVRELLLGAGANHHPQQNNNKTNFSSTTKNKQPKQLPVWAVTLTASIVAALWRVTITPLDTVKTSLQVGSSMAFVKEKIRQQGILVLWDGALGNSLATLVGHYPWFIVHNFLDARLPQANKKRRKLVLLRRALIGFFSSMSSDCVSNGIRVIKTYQQTSAISITYKQAFLELLQASNGPAFVLRGLKLKILSNGLSGILFAILWKMILEYLNNNNKTNNKNNANEEEEETTSAAANNNNNNNKTKSD